MHAGYFQPRPSRGRSLFIPGVDPDKSYFFIVDNDGCPDTAVITLEGGSETMLPDTLIRFCPGGSVIRLNDIYPGMNGRTQPAFAGGSLDFDPGVDDARLYLFITGEMTCADTAEVTFESTDLDAVSFPRIRLCQGGSLRIGVPPGKYGRVRQYGQYSYSYF